MTNTKVQHALTRHLTNDADSVSIETGIAGLGALISTLGELDPEDRRDVLALCGRLVTLYAEHGIDPDGDVSFGLNQAFAKLGYDSESVED